MIILGMLIGDRYEILDKIGTGGMSDVYKAKDLKLNRSVAVKVLKQEFSENSSFVSKFRIEAQAAAGLSHPNIVNVYDVGEEDGIHYIVMELVEGITLKNYIEKKARLSVREAISIAIQVSMGIEAAHGNHIIHRDIKPQNVIISKDGKVKVTDFGIAKAATSNTITSNVMGSVHYTSPEQARGGFSDEKSDIYSLGCTMFEMLTGHVPFDGETTVAIAIKHIQDEMPSPREYIPEIPISVEKIILKCTQKSPDRRYQNMAELIIDLKKSLLTPDEDFVQMVDVDVAAATRTVSDEEIEEIKQRTGSIELNENLMRLNEPVERKKKVVPPAVIEDEYEEDDEDEDDEDEYDDEDIDPKMERITTILAIVAAVIIGIIALLLVAKVTGVIGSNPDKDGQEQSESVEMPFVVGKSADEAQKLLADLGLNVEIKTEENPEYEENTVISQSVKEGEMIKTGDTITLVVSAGTQGVVLPDLKNKSKEEAEAKLDELKLNYLVQEVADDVVKEGYVVGYGNKNAGDLALTGETITLNVSTGPAVKKTEVPNLVGSTEADAKTKLQNASLAVGTVTEEYSDTVTKGTVISQSLASGTEASEGATVNFVVSLGKKEIIYTCVTTIQAPTGYSSGDATITLTAEDGTVKTFTTSQFPFSINETGFKCESGSYKISFVKQTTVENLDQETGETVISTIPETVTTDAQSVTFTKAN